MSPSILLVPAPRKVADIFTTAQLERLRALGTLHIFDDAPPTQLQFEAIAPTLEILIGQLDMPQARLEQAPRLRAICNVEGNFLPNIDYACAAARGIRVLNISPVFAEPVAEVALGMAISLARGISRSDRYFRQGTEQYGLAANTEAYSLHRQTVGFIGFGDLGRAILPLLAPFHPRVKALNLIVNFWVDLVQELVIDYFLNLLFLDLLVHCNLKHLVFFLLLLCHLLFLFLL